MFHHRGKAEAHKKGEGIPAVAINQPVVPVIPE